MFHGSVVGHYAPYAWHIKSQGSLAELGLEAEPVVVVRVVLKGGVWRLTSKPVTENCSRLVNQDELEAHPGSQVPQSYCGNFNIYIGIYGYIVRVILELSLMLKRLVNDMKHCNWQVE